MRNVSVRHVSGDRFRIDIGTHTLAVDQPTDVGGADTAPTPTELFVASLASCVAHYARRYLARHEISPDGLEVSASYELGTSPARVSEVQVVVRLAADLTVERRAGLLAVASHCTVHNSITHPPSISVILAEEVVPVP